MIAGWFGDRSRRQKMTLSVRNLQSLLVSLMGALVVSSLCISAAIGPVPVI
jgi:hypothetical protein